MTTRTFLAFLLAICLAFAARGQAPPAADILIADFEGEGWGEWTVTGNAFGPGPARGTLARQQPVSGFNGRGLVNSYHDGDGTTGTLTSPEFTIERSHISLLVGGGGFEGKTCVNLLVDGKAVHSATGRKEGSEELDFAAWDVRELRGKRARIQVVDDATGGWGHVLCDHVIQTDNPPRNAPAGREIVAEKRYLLLPVQNGGRMRGMTVSVDGRVEREFQIELAEGKPDWWAPLEIAAWRGKSLSVGVDRLATTSKALEQVRQDDALPARSTARPLYHFAPPTGWMNDPNGLVYHNGEYHLFYQLNPYGTRWNNMSWGHAVSRDLVRWEDLPVALHQQNGVMIFSGSAVSDASNTSGFAPAGKPGPLIAIYTGHRPQGGRQTQEIAYSNDDGRTWTKYEKNPVIDIQSTGFRDPKVFWHAPTKKWVMVVALADEKKVKLYGSPNLREWQHLSDFGPAGAKDAPNWECPDLFPLPVERSAPGGGPPVHKWVLHINVGGGGPVGGSGAQYFVGEFDGTAFRPDHPANHVSWTDYGKDFYAAITWADVPEQDGRRLWLGWMSNVQYAHAIPPGGDWRSMMSVPRALALRNVDGDLRIVQQPVRGLQSLRGEHKALAKAQLAAGTTRVTEDAGEAFELIAEFTPADAKSFGLKLHADGGQETLVGYDVAKQEVFVDRTKSGNTAFHGEFARGRHAALVRPGTGGRIKLHVLVDRYSVEVFANDGERVVTDLVFPTDEGRAVEVYADGGAAEYTLDLWTLRTP